VTSPPQRQFSLDRFQREAIAHLDAGRSVLVAAPTGSGKTVIAEHAIDRGLESGSRVFYTTPIKALSNQKFRDLSERIGSSRVGLLTGDNAVNPDADIVVMTTEVLRNMLYEGRQLADLSAVILDEVHYLEDAFRGPVWEEVILHLPQWVRLVCLSATVSNAEELTGWLSSIRGETGCVVETHRPVELQHLYAVGDRRNHQLHVIPTLLDANPNSEGFRFDPEGRRGAQRQRPNRSPWTVPSRLDVLDHLEERDLLPVIWFVFSRKGCDEAASNLARAGARYTSGEEADRIREIANERLEGLASEDLGVLDARSWQERLERGIASHHAGMVPAFKETVERCFAEGLVPVVFATETLALGVNLPARSVVIDKLTKFTGDGHDLLTPAQFTQLTGRAGRRGIDDQGYAVVPWSPFTQFDQVAALAGSRSFRLRSAFRPTYNMATNLLQRFDAGEARALLGRSFAQYQADATVVKIEERLRHERQRLADLHEQVAELAETEPVGETVEISDAVSRLRPGDLVHGDDGKRFAVLGVSWRRGGRARIRLVSEGAHEARWDMAELDVAPITLGRIELPFPMAPERLDYRQDVAARIRRSSAGRGARRQRRAGQREDPTRALARTSNEIRLLETRLRQTGSSISRQFDAVCEVLRSAGYLDGWTVTEQGRTLAGIYHERDLLVAEALNHGVFDDLNEAELASLASTFVYEHRSPGPPPDPWFPSPTVGERFDTVIELWGVLHWRERAEGVSETARPDPGFAPVAHAWARGESLPRLLDQSSDMTAGDFVRNVKQIIDLVGQISTVAPRPATQATARRAGDALHRGVVALSGSVAVP